MVTELPPDLQARFQKKFSPAPEAPLIQLMGPWGSGCRRLAFDFLKPAEHALWITPRWEIYAPVLWKVAEAQGIDLYGLELRERRKFRPLLQDIVSSQAFDAVILEGFKLTSGEGFFLQHLVRPFGTSMKILIIDERPHSFCPKRVHLSLSHRSFRLTWSKGGPQTPRHIPFEYFHSLLDDHELLGVNPESP